LASVRRLACLGACVLAGGVALAVPATAAAPARLLVGGDEFRLTLSRASVKAGRVLVQLQNRGEDDHDLRLQRITSKPDAPVARWAVTKPGELAELTLSLRRGRYRLWCSLPGHRELGMKATVRVSRRR
jgi:uncharacterized cupredoxin-like copper-binding protein